LSESGPCCRRSPTAGRPGIKSNLRNRQPESLNDNQRAAPGDCVTERSPNRTPPATGTGKNMADTEVKASLSPGANEPPSPSHPAAPANPLPDAPTPITHIQPLPTTSSAYRAIANLNRGFEQDRRNLADLQGFNFFPEEDLLAWGNELGRLQADASLRLLEALHERLMNNALYYDRLCWTKEKQLEDPDDVLLKAERRKRELERERRASEETGEGEQP
jgi:hypothetical protein